MTNNTLRTLIIILREARIYTRNNGKTCVVFMIYEKQQFTQTKRVKKKKKTSIDGNGMNTNAPHIPRRAHIHT